MQTDRLLAIAAMVRKLPPEKFDMDTWKCGSTLCAIGHAIERGLLPELELIALDPTWGISRKGEGEIPYGRCFAVVGAVLEISTSDAGRLFSSLELEEEDEGEPKETPESVALRIEKYVAEGGFAELEQGDD